MGLGFFAPLFFAGAALIGVPWLIHQIRRPERDVVRFSSLMFLPDEKKEVIERRRIQHPLLMLLRMLLLLLLVAAFTRPYLESLLLADAPDVTSRRHVILLDTSLSMSPNMAEAKEQALAILSDLPEGDRVGVVRFARSVEIAATVADPDVPNSGSVTAARHAIESTEAGWGTTDFVVGLQAAEQLLLEGAGETGFVLHLISDFQAAGMPGGEVGWRLSSRVEFDPVVIGEGLENVVVEELAVREIGEKGLQVRARIRNWAEGNARSLEARLVVDDRQVDSRKVHVLPGHSSQVRFSAERNGDQPISGYVSVDGDEMDLDNLRYFAWNPRQSRRVALFKSEKKSGRWPFDRLVSAAVPDDSELPWVVTSVASGNVVEELKVDPDVVVSNGLVRMDASDLRDYVREGGALFLALGEGLNLEWANRFFQGAGVRVNEARFEKAQEARFESISWVDLDHRIFYPFRGPQFNDFSSVRVFNYYALGIDSDDATVLARFENGDPAVVESNLGTGKVIVWAGGVDLGWTNLAKTPRFVPLIHETLRYLSGEQPNVDTYTVGDMKSLPMEIHDVSGPWTVNLASISGRTVEEQLDFQTARPQSFSMPGLFRWKEQSEGEWTRVEAVNIESREGNPARVSVSEFEIKLCDAPLLDRKPQNEGDEFAVVGESVVREEYGYGAMILLLGILLLESWYAAHLGARERV